MGAFFVEKTVPPPLIKKLFPPLEMKRQSGQFIKLTQAGQFEGYASVFHCVDLGYDEVMAVAFSDSLKKRGPSAIKMLWQHDSAQPIGKWIDVREDKHGLRVIGQLNLDVAKAREVLSLMRDGTIDGLSIGFRTQKSSLNKTSGVRHLIKLDLWEISIVTFPMLPQARVSAVKRRVDNYEHTKSVTAAHYYKASLKRIVNYLNQLKD